MNKQSAQLEKSSSNYESLETKKLSIEKQLVKDKEKLAKLQREIRDIETVIENQVKS